MEILKKITTAEAYLLIACDDATFKNLLKNTLVDLLLKKVLRIEEQNFQPDNNDPAQIISYIKAGENIKKYKAKAHEEIFLKTFVDNEELEIIFRHYVSMVYENAGSKRSYIKGIRKNAAMRAYFSNGILTFLFGAVILTAQGAKVMDKINEELSELEKTLPKLAETNPKKAKAIINEINANVLLLNSFDLDLIKKVDSQFKSVISNSSESSIHFDGVDFILFDIYFNGFDTEFDTEFDSNEFSGDGSWGDSDGCSDSGCSSCSGCGGCGGCS